MFFSFPCEVDLFYGKTFTTVELILSKFVLALSEFYQDFCNCRTEDISRVKTEQTGIHGFFIIVQLSSTVALFELPQLLATFQVFLTFTSLSFSVFRINTLVPVPEILVLL